MTELIKGNRKRNFRFAVAAKCKDGADRTCVKSAINITATTTTMTKNLFTSGDYHHHHHYSDIDYNDRVNKKPKNLKVRILQVSDQRINTIDNEQHHKGITTNAAKTKKKKKKKLPVPDKLLVSSSMSSISSSTGKMPLRKKLKMKNYSCNIRSFSSSSSIMLRNKYEERIHKNRANARQQYQKFKIFECDQCHFSSKTYTMSRIRQHVKSVHDQQKQLQYICDQCGYATAIYGNLITHGRSVHERLRSYGCDRCDYAAGNYRNLLDHTKVIHERLQSYRCDRCHFSANYYSTIKKHAISIHFRLYRYGCDKCGYSTDYYRRIKVHIKSVHERVCQYGCDRCDYASAHYSSIITHAKLIHDRQLRQYRCDNCDFITHSKACQKYHVERMHHHRLQQNRHQQRIAIKYYHHCDRCDYTSQIKQDISKHVQDVHNLIVGGKDSLLKFTQNTTNDDNRDFIINLDQRFRYEDSNRKTLLLKPIKIMLSRLKMFQCQRCSCTVTQKQTHQKHLQNISNKIHQDDNVYNMMCDHCGLQNSGKTVLHKLVKAVDVKSVCDRQPKLHQCDRCDYSGVQRVHVMTHAKSIHDKQRNYECDRCEYRGVQRVQVLAHAKSVHDKLRQYGCDWCEYNTANYSNLYRHARAAHYNIKDFQCDRCGFTAARRVSLLQHAKVIHDIRLRKYGCDQCDYLATTKANRKYHVQRVHNHHSDVYIWSKKFPDGHLPPIKAMSTQIDRRSVISQNLGFSKNLKVPNKNRHHQCDQCDYFSVDATSMNLMQHVKTMHYNNRHQRTQQQQQQPQQQQQQKNLISQKRSQSQCDYSKNVDVDNEQKLQSLPLTKSEPIYSEMTTVLSEGTNMLLDEFQFVSTNEISYHCRWCIDNINLFLANDVKFSSAVDFERHLAEDHSSNMKDYNMMNGTFL